jgi:pyruvate/2-oxoglutarate dehydrogenase complex dihydrolipoamide dehydrogenase (E3) component
VSNKGVESWLKSMKNCTVFDGHARFEDAHSVSIGNEWLGSGKDIH